MAQERAEARPGLDALSQTIEGLEARLSEMMEARAAGAAPRGPARATDYRDRLPRDRRLPVEPVNARLDSELRDIARTLKDLRQSVRDDFTASLRDELAGLHTMLSHIERQTDTRDIDDDARSELLRISEGVDWLLSNAAADDDSRLMAEFDHLQSLLRGLADAKSVARLESRFDTLERQIAPFDPARLDLELTALARGLDDVRHWLETNDSGHSLQDIEARMAGLAEAMEVLCARIPTSDDRLDGQMHAIERRIDDIDRNLERIGRRQSETPRDPAVERLEARLGELSNAVAAVDWQMRDQSATQATLMENLDAVARRIESHNSADAHTKLEARIETLTNAVDRIGAERNTLGKAVATLSDKVGDIDLAGVERRITAQISAQISAMPVAGADPELRRKIEARLAAETGIAERLDALDLAGLEERLSRKIAAVEQSGAESRLSAQLTALANRLEESRRDSSGPELQKLERQIAELTTLMNRPEPKLPIGELEERIGARIEALSASNDDMVIEAAQHAAEEALKTFEASRKGEADEHIEIIKGLAADLKALRMPANADQDKASAGLQETLKTIANRLDAMPDAGAPQAAPKARPPVQPTAPLGPSPFETRFRAMPPRENPEEDDSRDVLDILSRVRSGQRENRQAAHGPVLPVHDRPGEESRKRVLSKPAGVRSEGLGPRAPRADLIAAARRAVHTAASEVGETGPDEASEPPKDRFSRRPVYLAAGAILLAIMSYPLLTGMGRDRDAILQATQSLEASALRRETPAPARVSTAAPARAPATIDLTMTPVVKSNFAPEAPEEVASAPVRAFSMIETDNDLITGSIEPDAPEPTDGLPSLAETAPSAAEKLKKAAIALENKQEKPVETAAVTTREVLDALNAPAKQGPEAAELSVETMPAASTDTPRASAAPRAATDGFRAITADLPPGLETRALADAAKAGNPAALYEIGLRYLDGLGFDQDFAKAAFWFDLAAERGSAPGAFQLGSLYEKGTGLGEDAGKAVALYREAADKGNVSAMHNLAVMLANGAGDARPDFTEAAKWFQKAADHGVADSQFNLAILHARGAGTEADLLQSYKWFAVAAMEGDAEAAKRRDEVAEALGDADLRRARKLADEWKAEAPDETANRLTSPREWVPDDLVAAATTVDKEAVVRDIQTILNNNGYDAGPADGLLGAKTDAAIRAFQQANGFAADGAITPELVKELLARNSA
ncbi:SEL1-like repeat protein [Martelella soudanensis]|uniref:SEL1-like repeat protein n=1 Tax=unclassified Martelella TaxID=2629616 RepID=UPI0015DEF780|nr:MULTISPECIES: SEL1-like repeat protein [unclassified Martelella]